MLNSIRLSFARTPLLLVLAMGSTSVSAQLFDRFVSPGPLAEPHSEFEGVQNCTLCHTIGSKDYDVKCLACHTEIKIRKEKGRGFHADKERCEECHHDHKGRDYEMIEWDPEKFNHIEAGWLLRGKHAQVPCADCHTQNRVHPKTKKPTGTRSYLNAPLTCVGCHAKENTHALSKKYDNRCELCHSERIEAWTVLKKPMPFRHDATRYPLTGLHKTVECMACHKFPSPERRHFKPLPFESCENCHVDVHKGAFGKQCQSCHATDRKFTVVPAALLGGKAPTAPEPPQGVRNESVAPAPAVKAPAGGFDHSKTRFPLKGFHEKTACEACHPNSKKNGFKVARFASCADCHANPHGDQVKTLQCQSCHTETNPWSTVTFTATDHNRVAKFKLEGMHNDLACESCHPSGKFKPLQHSTCDSCHVNPHPKEEITEACTTCHSEISFSKIRYDHAKTGYPLENKHASTPCLSCHVRQEFKKTPKECQECHQDLHGKSIPDKCQSCHNTTGFQNAFNFKHESFSAFVLDGGHERQRCVKCHAGHLDGQYALGSKACVSCHVDVHENANGKECEKCHVTSGWEVGRREKNHDLGFFVLAGRHDDLPCTTCHRDDRPRNRGMGRNCLSCHQGTDTHRGTLGPQCGECHTQNQWTPSTFDHNRTRFELSGAHRYLRCGECHVNNLYSGLPEDCVFCHQKNFIQSAALVPAHQNLNLACSQCHSTTSWRPARGK